MTSTQRATLTGMLTATQVSPVVRDLTTGNVLREGTITRKDPTELTEVILPDLREIPVKRTTIKYSDTVDEGTYVPEKLDKNLLLSNQKAFDRSLSYKPGKLVKRFTTCDDPTKKVTYSMTNEDLSDKPSVSDIRRVNLSYRFGSHIEQGRVIVPVELPMLREDRILTKGYNTDNIDLLYPNRPLRSQDTHGIHGKNRMDYNKSLVS